MKQSHQVFLLHLGITAFLQATIINVPGDVPTIQTGIDSASVGDTVLVQPGRYVENINFEGKNIVVGSLFLTTDDTSYILQTVIDGDSSGSVVIFENGETSSAVLCGFTITNGAAQNGGGIHCNGANPSLLHLEISGNAADAGGGIYATESGLQLNHISIVDNVALGLGGGMCILGHSYPQMNHLSVSKNRADKGGGIYFHHATTTLANAVIDHNIAVRAGGGIYLEYHPLALMNVTITNNTCSTYGGGIFNYSATLRLSDVDITHNFARETGGGIFFSDGYALFDSDNRSSIYLNDATIGKDLACYRQTYPINVVVDTFTVLNPTDMHANPADLFLFDILHSRLIQVHADVFVNPAGSNNNSGLTADAPLQTIDMALTLITADSLNPRTIHLAEGTYSNSTNGDRFPIIMQDFISLEGAGQNTTLLDAEGFSSVIRFNGNRGCAVRSLTVTGGSNHSAKHGIGVYCNDSSVDFDHVSIRNNNGMNWAGGGIYARYSSINVSYSAIAENTSEHGGGIYARYSSINVSYSAISENTSTSGGGIYSKSSSIVLDHVAIFNNSAIAEGGGIHTINADIILSKSSVRNNVASAFGGGIYRYGCNGNITFDESNLSSIYNNQSPNGGDLYWDTPWCDAPSPMSVVLDTFTVVYPGRYHVLPLNAFSFEISNHTIPQYAADLFVSPTGDDANDGLSPGNPLRTITQALITIVTDILNPRTIFLAEGTYSPDNTGELFPLLLGDYLSLSGDSVTTVVIDAQGAGSGMRLYNTKGTAVMRLTLTGGSTNLGGGIYSSNSDILLDRLLITGNSATQNGGAVALIKSNGELKHSTLTNNSVPDLYSVSSHIKISSSIIWPARHLGIWLVNTYDAGSDSVVIRYSAIRGGLGWIIVDEGVNLVWSEGNIDVSPLFCHWDIGNYYLSAGSPCLETGENGTNVGALGLGCEIPVAVQYDLDAAVITYELHPAFPNPFNPTVTIRFDLPEGVMVHLLIYDLQGREITRLADGYRQPGYHESTWDGRDAEGRELSSGIYIAHLVTPGYSKSIKMVLLK
ncbi:FlgD immunoglobulin-like domain containing protein [Candidatus Neomarinimicrobiota bacterium]